MKKAFDHVTRFVLMILFPLAFTACSKPSPSPIPATVTIVSIGPSFGSAGTPVMVTGTHFDATPSKNTVKFNGMTAVVSGGTTTTLNVTAPAGGTTGPVTVSNSTGSATGPVFTYTTGSAPTIESINPVAGKAGTSVTITGSNFDITPANNTVKFNGTAATVSSASTTSLVVSAPAGGSTGPVTVTNGGGTSTGPTFTYTNGPAVYVSYDE